MASTMVVPNGDYSVFAELLHRVGVIGVFRYKVDISLDTHVKQLIQNFLITLGIVHEVLCPDNLLHSANTFNTSVQVIWMAEVVEGDGWVVINIGVDQG